MIIAISHLTPWILLVFSSALSFLLGLKAAAVFFQKRLKKAHARTALLQDTLNNLPGYIFVKDVDNDLRYLFLNDLYYTLSGQPPASGIGLNDTEWPREGSDAFHRQDLALIRSGESFCQVEQIHKQNGELVQSKLYKKVVAGSNGHRLIVGMGLDVSEELRLKKELMQNIQDLNTYIKNEKTTNASLAQIVMEDDYDTNVQAILDLIVKQLNADRAALGIFGDDNTFRIEFESRSAEVPSLKTLADPDILQQFLRWKDRLTEEKELYIPDIPHSQYARLFEKTASKTVLFVAVEVNHRLYGVLGVGFLKEVKPITEVERNIFRSSAGIITLAREKQLQQEKLELMTRQNNMVLSTMPISVILFDRDRNVLNCNQAALNMFGRTLEEMRTLPCYETMCGSKGVPALCTVSEILRTQAPVSFEVVMNGKECQIKALPIFDETGTIVNITEVISDVSDLRRGQRQLEAALKEAEAANRAKTYFLATMSHELRTPLNAVLGFSELLQNGDLSPAEQIDYLKAIHFAGNSLLFLINDILDLSRLEAKQVELSPRPTDLTQLLNELKAVFSYKVNQQGLYFEVNTPADLPILSLDNVRLRQVLLNIIGNAVKFTSTGGITVNASLDASNHLTISVHDTGIGIKPEAREKIFEPFTQQDAVRDTHIYKGSGLGLAISRRLIDCMNGRIRLESEEGKGSTFIIELNDVTRADPVAPAAPKAVDAQARFPEKRVLIVDDIPLNLKVLSAMLDRLHVKSVSAESGREALAILSKDPAFDLVLTDMWMPEMSGAQLAEQIRRFPGFNRLPIVAVTADTEANQNFELSHFSEILMKPISNEKLKRLLLTL